MVLSRLFGGKSMLEGPARNLYVGIIAQSREPGFYLGLGVEDSVEGRFDMISIHAFLVMHRLKQDRDKTEGFSQQLYDLMFADMEINLRELGIGDMGLGKRIKKLAKKFYGRIGAYEEGLDRTDDDNKTLENAVKRNLYRENEKITTAENVRWMADYIRREADNLKTQNIDALMEGTITFGAPPPIIEGQGEVGL